MQEEEEGGDWVPYPYSASDDHFGQPYGPALPMNVKLVIPIQGQIWMKNKLLPTSGFQS